MKKRCNNCGEVYTASEDENPQTKICDDCFEDQENHQFDELDQISDADPGL